MARTTKRSAAHECSRTEADGRPPAWRAGRARAALAALAVLAGSGTAGAFPDGAPWETADDAEGCTSCHFDSPDPRDSAHLTLSGLPERIAPGRRYELLLTLDDEALRLAGFLLTVTSNGAAAGSLAAADAASETAGAQARSTRAGAAPAAPGRAGWQLVWTAPASLAGPVRFDVWANAANDDQSPFGDRTHHRRWELPADPADTASAGTGSQRRTRVWDTCGFRVRAKRRVHARGCRCMPVMRSCFPGAHRGPTS